MQAAPAQRKLPINSIVGGVAVAKHGAIKGPHRVVRRAYGWARRGALALLLAGATTVPTLAVAAGPPMQASGTVQPTNFTLTAIRFADGNVIIDGHEVLVISGSFNGSIDQADEIVIHPDGSAVDHFVGTLTGTVVNCGTGTIPLQGEALIVGNALDGHLAFINQSGNSLEAHADLKVTGTVPNLVYTGTYLCN